MIDDQYGYVFAVDPGEATGFVVYNTRGGGAVINDGILPHLDFLDFAWGFLHTDVKVLVACESFIITPATIKKVRKHSSLEQIGALHWMANFKGHAFNLQQPSHAKKFVTDTTLKNAGWYTTGPAHKNDAYRHLILACARNGTLLVTL